MLRRSLTALVAVAVVGSTAVDLAAADPLSEVRERLEDARHERARLEERVAGATRRLDELEQEIAAAADELAALEAELVTLDEDRRALHDDVAIRVRAVFKHGRDLDPVTVFLASEDPRAALLRAETVEHVVAAGRVDGEALAAAGARVAAARDRLAERSERLRELRAEHALVAEELGDAFDRALQVERRLEREERETRERLERERRERERQRRARQAAGTTSGATARASTGTACPLDQPRHFTDTWGAARSGGRRHRGTDIMGPLGTPVRAITDGVWDVQRPGASAGLWAILRGHDGNHYWYLHLDAHVVGDGARVSAGQQVATNGSTGNATAGAEHVHFELHPGGGAAVNPYPLLRRVCG